MAARRKRLGHGRPDGRRPRKKRYLVVTNGEVTEPQYFAGLTRELGDVVIEVRHFRKDPSALAETARALKTREEEAVSSTSGLIADGFENVFVVTDVDEFTAGQLRDAQRTCADCRMELIVSNPCFEVWLVDHVACCPETFSQTRDVEAKAAELGLVEGSRNKQVVYSAIAGKRDIACANASKHNSAERKRVRAQLDKTAFGPWTDMPVVIGLLARTGKRTG